MRLPALPALAILSCLLLAGCTGTQQEDPAAGDVMAPKEPAGDAMDEGPQGGEDPASEPTPPAHEVYTSGHPMEGKSVPTYEAAPLNGHHGALQVYEGGVVLVTTWASWCSICKGDEPIWEQMFTDYAEFGLTVFAVSREASQTNAQSYIDGKSYDYPAFWDDGVNAALGMRDYQPNHMLIDRDGTVVSVYEGSLRSRPGGEDGLRADIESLLGPQA